jgi:hypothetical protein
MTKNAREQGKQQTQNATKEKAGKAEITFYGDTLDPLQFLP